MPKKGIPAREEALKRSVERLEALIDEAPIGICTTDLKGKVTYVNKRFEEASGYSWEEVVGKSGFKLGFLSHETLKLLRKRIKERLLGMPPQLLEIQFKCKDGHWIWVAMEGKLIRNRGIPVGFQISAADITERKQAEEALRESEEKYRNLFEQASDAIAIVDLKGVITSVNPTGLRLTGYSEAELLGKHFLRMPALRAKDLPKYMRIFSSLLRGKTPKPFEINYYRKDGTQRLVEVHPSFLEVAGKKIGIQAVMTDITERKQAEELYRTLANSSAAGVNIIQDGKFVFVNPETQKFTGFTEDELLGTDPLQYVHPEDRERAKKEVVEMLKGNRSSPYEFRLIGKKGEIIWVMATVTSIRYKGKRARLENLMDITERKRMEEEIRRNYDIQTVVNSLLRLSLRNIPLEELLKAALNLILSIPWLTLESRGGIFLVEDDPEVLVMKAQNRLAEPIQRACAWVPFGRCLCGRAALTQEIQFAERVDERHETRYEGIIPHGHYCVPILFAGKTLGVINTYVREGHGSEQREKEFLTAIADTLAGVIERKQMEEELKKAQEQLVRSERLAAIGQLAGGVGHELRNPLGAIKNATYYIKGKVAKSELAQKEPRVMEFLDIIEDEINSSNKIINDLLGFSRVGKPTVSPARIDKVIEDALSHLTIPENIEVVIKLDTDLPEVEVDTNQLRQVLVNMIINAVQAMPEGGKLTLGAKKKDKFLEVKISDTGCGIPEENIGKIFDPLFTTRAKGIGLGLAVSKAIIDRHQGFIGVESEVGKGTTFTIKLPLTVE